MDLSLKTQVLGCGRLSIIGFDPFGREVLRFAISTETEFGNRLASSSSFLRKANKQNEAVKGKWEPVDYYSDEDDLTSQSAMTMMTPSNYGG